MSSNLQLTTLVFEVHIKPSMSQFQGLINTFRSLWSQTIAHIVYLGLTTIRNFCCSPKSFRYYSSVNRMPDSSCAVVLASDGKSRKSSKNSRIDLGDITPHNLKLLKKVNQVSKLVIDLQWKPPNAITDNVIIRLM